MKDSYVLKLSDTQATLETVGGKGLSLAVYWALLHSQEKVRALRRSFSS